MHMYIYTYIYRHIARGSLDYGNVPYALNSNSAMQAEGFADCLEAEFFSIVTIGSTVNIVDIRVVF